MTAAKRPPKRAYHQHGQGFVAKALPYLLEPVADITLPDETLTPPSAPRSSGTAKWSRTRAAS